MPLITRTGKGEPLTHVELDGNWTDLDVRTGPGWRDMIAPIRVDGVPNNAAPVSTNFGPAGSPQRQEYAFALDRYAFIQPFHVDHDVKPGGQALVHVHWSTNGTNTGNVRWAFHISRALGHNQANFAAPVTYFVEQAGGGSAWRHMIGEVDIADALTLSEPDELILVTLQRVDPTVGSNTDTVFGLMCDLHYETDRHSTPNRSPNFYGA